MALHESLIITVFGSQVQMSDDALFLADFLHSAATTIEIRNDNKSCLSTLSNVWELKVVKQQVKLI